MPAGVKDWINNAQREWRAANAGSYPGQLHPGGQPCAAQLLATASVRRVPRIRFGQRWVNILWALPIAFVLLIVGVAVAHALRPQPGVQAFVVLYL